MTICLLMPVFNEPSLGELLFNLRGLAPDLGGVEVVLVDDGSKVPLDASTLPPPTVKFPLFCPGRRSAWARAPRWRRHGRLHSAADRLRPR